MNAFPLSTENKTNFKFKSSKSVNFWCPPFSHITNSMKYGICFTASTTWSSTSLLMALLTKISNSTHYYVQISSNLKHVVSKKFDQFGINDQVVGKVLPVETAKLFLCSQDDNIHSRITTCIYGKYVLYVLLPFIYIFYSSKCPSIKFLFRFDLIRGYRLQVVYNLRWS